ncbi:MAG TPA: DUF4363 family protein [Clostridia bacterium]|nr:DUF4363 family protein [Clostridia bacterium]
MRVVVATVLILVIFLVGAFMINKYVNNACGRLLEDVGELDRSIKGENWARGREHVQNLKKQWEMTKKGWLLFLEHYETDPIDISLTRLEQYVEVENKALASGEMAELRLLIDSVRSKENFKLENIL